MSAKVTTSILFAALFTLGVPALASAKRAAPPTTKICNKTKSKQYVAQMSYAGRGSHRTSGWTYLKPGECRNYRSDAYHVRGHSFATKTKGRSPTVRGCVTYAKVFSVISSRKDHGDAAKCKAKKGNVVDFVPARSRRGTLDIE